MPTRDAAPASSQVQRPSGGVFSQPGSAAHARLGNACARAGGLLSAGLEPVIEQLPAGFSRDLRGCERFLLGLIDATSGITAAYKFNLAFFESLGSAGVDLLYRVRGAIPEGPLVIADAKRGDIGTTAEHYARALYERLDAHAATVNPLMGRDSAAPFLAHADRLTFFLALTSNPGAADFLVPGGLFAKIAGTVAGWSVHANAGLVVGATQASLAAEVRRAAPGLPVLVPGLGAQGGDLAATARALAAPGVAGPLFHVTRGLLPGPGDAGDVFEIVRAKALSWRDQINAAMRDADAGGRS